MPFDSKEIARLWRNRAGQFASILEGGAEELAVMVEAESKRAMQTLIYSKPEDIGRSGRRLWVRTGALMAGEKARVKAPGVVTLTNNVSYAEPRHEANKPGRRQINPARTAHWREVIGPTIRAAQLRFYEERLQAIWRKQ